MTDRYGSFRGAVIQQMPPRMPIGALGGEFLRRMAMDSVLLAAAPIADRIWLGNFNIDAILDPASMVYNDALGASTTLSIGDKTYPSVLAAAASTVSAGSRSIIASVTIANYPKPIWAQLGYASRDACIAAQPMKNGTVDLWATIAGAAATGNVSWHIKGCDA